MGCSGARTVSPKVMTQKDCTSVSLELHIVFDPLMPELLITRWFCRFGAELLLSFQVSHIASGLLSDVWQCMVGAFALAHITRSDPE